MTKIPNIQKKFSVDNYKSLRIQSLIFSKQVRQFVYGVTFWLVREIFHNFGQRYIINTASIANRIFTLIDVVVKIKRTLVLCKQPIFMSEIKRIQILRNISNVCNIAFTVTCPLRDVLMHTNRRTDMKEIGFYSHHGNAHRNSCSSRGNFTRRESFGL